MKNIFKDMLENDVEVSCSTIGFFVGKNPLDFWEIVFRDYSAKIHKTFSSRKDATDFLEKMFGEKVIVIREMG